MGGLWISIMIDMLAIMTLVVIVFGMGVFVGANLYD